MPGVGPKSAQRIAYWLLNSSRDSALRLADAIVEVKDTVHFCSVCFNYAEGDVCDVCASGRRDRGLICVVSEPRDIAAIERTSAFNGVYHVLGGASFRLLTASAPTTCTWQNSWRVLPWKMCAKWCWQPTRT